MTQHAEKLKRTHKALNEATNLLGTATAVAPEEILLQTRHAYDTVDQVRDKALKLLEKINREDLYPHA